MALQISGARNSCGCFSKREREVLFCVKGAQEQDKGVSSSSLTTGLNSEIALGRQESPWQIPRSMVLEELIIRGLKPLTGGMGGEEKSKRSFL